MSAVLARHLSVGNPSHGISLEYSLKPCAIGISSLPFKNFSQKIFTIYFTKFCKWSQKISVFANKIFITSSVTFITFSVKVLSNYIVPCAVIILSVRSWMCLIHFVFLFSLTLLRTYLFYFINCSPPLHFKCLQIFLLPLL